MKLIRRHVNCRGSQAIHLFVSAFTTDHFILYLGSKFIIICHRMCRIIKLCREYVSLLSFQKRSFDVGEDYIDYLK